MTYRELDEAANRVAHLLAREGAGPGEILSRCCFRGRPRPSSRYWACSRPGRPTCRSTRRYPDERLEFMVTDAAPIAAAHHHRTVLEVQGGHALALIDISRLPMIRLSLGPRFRRPRPTRWRTHHHLGHHRGSERRGGNHLNVAHLFESLDAGLEADRGPSVDPMPLLCVRLLGLGDLGRSLAGGRLVVVPERSDRVHPKTSTPLLISRRRDVLTQTPSAAAALSVDGLESVALVLGGEACPPKVVDRWAPGRR